MNTDNYIQKKIEKIVTATYVVSGIFHYDEPLRHAMRDTALCLLKRNPATHTGASQSQILVDAELSKQDMHSLVSFLDIAAVAGLISKMNYDILKKEFVNAITMISDIDGVLSTPGSSIASANSYYLSENFFAVDQIDNSQNHHITNTLGQYTSINSSSKNTAEITPKSKGHQIQQASSINMSFKGTAADLRTQLQRKSLSNQNHQSLNSLNHDTKLHRKDTIVSLLKNSDSLTIKDFVRVIKDCSEKTVQRDLLHLVDTGVLKKAGERRWSRYSLV